MPDAPYLTAGEAIGRLRGLDEFDPVDIERQIATFEPIAERYLGRAYVVRSFSWTVTLPRMVYDLVLPFVDVATISSVTIDGTAASAASYAPRLSTGIIRRSSGWPADVPIVVAGTHGDADTPAPLLDAACWYVFGALRMEASGTTRDVYATSFDGTFTRYSTPSWRDRRPTGWTEPDRLLNSLGNMHMALGIA